MNTKEYIESGILEAYVLGSLTNVERKQVEANIAMYPEIAAEVANIEGTMQHFAEATAVAPPDYMQDKIWSAIQSDVLNKDKANPTKIVPLNPPIQKMQFTWMRAAAVAVLLGSMALNFYLLHQNNRLNDSRTANTKLFDSLAKQQSVMLAQIDHYKKESNMMADPGMKTVVMQSMIKGHPMVATVYWSKDNGDTYIAMQHLPPAPSGMQYQMWVIQNGKPVSMGMLPNELAVANGMEKLEMKVTDGQAFAISLEKEGGNPSPTEVYVLGKISS